MSSNSEVERSGSRTEHGSSQGGAEDVEDKREDNVRDGKSTGEKQGEKGKKDSKSTDWLAWPKKIWNKLGIDSTVAKIMAKGALAPTIALAAYQSDAFSAEYTTLGYLVAIISILSFAIMPRAKHLQTLLLLVLATCFSTAIAILAIYCCVQARLHTTAKAPADAGGAGTSGTPTPGAQTVPYNSSAAAVAGIWLFVQIWLINAVRASNPAFTAPGIIACIFANVSMVYAPQFASMTTGLSFARRLIESFLTGFGIGSGVSLFVFPITSREIVFKEMTGYVMLLRKTLKANMSYIGSLEDANPFTRTPTGGPGQTRSPEAQGIKDALAGLSALHGKLAVDLTFAKREVAMGKLGPDDLQELFRRLRGLLMPIIGLSSIVDVFERITEENAWDRVEMSKSAQDVAGSEEEKLREAVEDWHQLSAMLQEPFTRMIGQIDEGFQHVLFALQLVPMPKKDAAAGQDVESKGDDPKPGQKGFTASFGQHVDHFSTKKENLLKDYCNLRGIQLSQDFFDDPEKGQFLAPDWYEDPTMAPRRQKYRRQLYLVLYMDFLVGSIGRTVLDFCVYADEKVESGKLSKNRLIVPGAKRMRKWVKSAVSRKQDAYGDDQDGMNEDNDRSSKVYLGDAYHKRRDPEHLPPTTFRERCGDVLRAIPHFLRSSESIFGLRVAVATMCLAIVAFLHQTQMFYVTNRLFWSQIMVTISMTPSAGQSVFSFLMRVGGTGSAMCSSYVVWYITDGKTAGVLVFFWFFAMWGFYIVLKFPKIVPVGMIFAVTNTLIIGYELQVRKIGVQVSETNGQAYYPIYELAPIRLATVSAGLILAWIWTIFPWPISEHSEVRRDLGSALYLLANYWSVVVETVRVRIRGDMLTLGEAGGPYQQLEKSRVKVFTKSMLLLQSLRTHSAFLKYDVPIGGKFPKATYDRIIARIQDIINFTSLISYSSQTFADMYLVNGEETSESRWLKDFRRLVKDIDITSRDVTTLLALLSASVASGQPLPPYLKAPDAYALTAKLEAVDKNILNVRHMLEPAFAAFACMQIATKCINDDLGALLRDIRELVGEMDFSFHAISTSDPSPHSSDDSLSSNDRDKSKAD